MALDLRQSLKLSQQLVMTPQLQQAIKLLQLNRMELQEVINQELVENPVLEELGETADQHPDGGDGLMGQDATNDPEAQQKRDEEAFTKPAETQDNLVSNQKDDFNWENYIEDFNSHSSTAPSMREVGEELPNFENVLTKTTTLESHLEWQLSMVTLADSEKKLGELIIGNLSDDGYLIANLEDLAKEAGIEFEDAQEVLKIIQRFDPVGVASQNLQECLMTQAELMNPRQPLVEKIIQNHLGDLEKKNYSAVARAFELPIEAIITATKLILEFEPKPGRSFESSQTHYVTPDIYVYKVADEFVIVLNEEGLPRLRISPYYKNILSSIKGGNKSDKEYVQ